MREYCRAVQELKPSRRGGNNLYVLRSGRDELDLDSHSESIFDGCIKVDVYVPTVDRDCK